MRLNFKAIAILIVSLIVIAIGIHLFSTTPLGSLSSNKLSNNYNYAFWVKQYQSKTANWSKATSYCSQKAHFQKPNCENINEISALLNINTTPQKHHSNKGFGKIKHFNSGKNHTKSAKELVKHDAKHK